MRQRSGPVGTVERGLCWRASVRVHRAPARRVGARVPPPAGLGEAARQPRPCPCSWSSRPAPVRHVSGRLHVSGDGSSRCRSARGMQRGSRRGREGSWCRSALGSAAESAVATGVVVPSARGCSGPPWARVSCCRSALGMQRNPPWARVSWCRSALGMQRNPPWAQGAGARQAGRQDRWLEASSLARREGTRHAGARGRHDGRWARHHRRRGRGHDHRRVHRNRDGTRCAQARVQVEPGEDRAADHDDREARERPGSRPRAPGARRGGRGRGRRGDVSRRGERLGPKVARGVPEVVQDRGRIGRPAHGFQVKHSRDKAVHCRRKPGMPIPELPQRRPELPFSNLV